MPTYKLRYEVTMIVTADGRAEAEALFTGFHAAARKALLWTSAVVMQSEYAVASAIRPSRVSEEFNEWASEPHRCPVAPARWLSGSFRQGFRPVEVPGEGGGARAV